MKHTLLPLTAALVFATPVPAQVTALSQFSPTGTIIGIAFDPLTDSVWIVRSFGADLRRYSRAGVFLSSVPRPGESANDADLEVAPVGLTLGSTTIPAGTLLFINGESNAAEIYAVDPTSGALLATLPTAFGLSHVVGGAYHPGRGTFFLVQDRVPAGTIDDSVVAEVSAANGSVLNTFQITAILPSYSVNYGDIDVALNGNLLIVSDDETAIAEFTPTGDFVQTMALPSGVSSLSGIAVSQAGCETWVSGTAGTVSSLGGLGAVPCCGSADFDGDGDAGTDLDIEAFFACLGGNCCPTCGSADFDGDGDSGTDLDIEAFFRVLGGGNC